MSSGKPDITLGKNFLPGFIDCRLFGKPSVVTAHHFHERPPAFNPDSPAQWPMLARLSLVA
jgi:hypothetical protein